MSVCHLTSGVEPRFQERESTIWQTTTYLIGDGGCRPKYYAQSLSDQRHMQVGFIDRNWMNTSLLQPRRTIRTQTYCSHADATRNQIAMNMKDNQGCKSTPPITVIVTNQINNQFTKITFRNNIETMKSLKWE